MTDKVFVTAQVPLSFEIPSLPNFIRVYGQESKPIAEIDDKVLQIIGEKWTAALIELARKKRKQ